MVEALIFVPLAVAAFALALPSNGSRPWLLPLGGSLHLILTVTVINNPVTPSPGAWLAFDAPGRLILALVSVLFCLSSFYAVGYLQHRQERDNRIFCACLLALLGMTSVVAASRHLGMLWIGMEATTLTTAPLIYFNRNRRSIEGTWKYLLICSVGIALSLLGTFFMAYAALRQGFAPTLMIDDLLRDAPNLSQPWLHGAFVLLLVGYGTKMGFAPMHTWKPDAYGEAPGLVGGLLAGAMTSCAFLGVIRVYAIATASGALYPRTILIAMGLLSMAVAGVFVIRQKDFKRMLAYSSVEHMGILALGLGLGGTAIFGALFHLVNNGLAKGLMFMTAGNIHRAYGSKLTDEVAGARVRLPVSGWLFLLGFLAASGSPPFGPFQSIMTIINSAQASGRGYIAGLMLVFLMMVFMGMGKTVLAVVQGKPSKEAASTGYHDNFLTAFPVILLMGIVLMLGLFMPPPLKTLLEESYASFPH
ncbi:hydrogenase [bacterium]|nr:MAG: hydrogenase [bacterium]